MARPKKAMVDYFPHFCNHKKTLTILENEFGNDGYAFWFKLLEILGSTEHHFIDCGDKHTWMFLLAKTRCNGDIVTKMLNLLAELGAIDQDLWQMKVIRSENFIQNLHDVYSRREINVMEKQDILELLPSTTPLNGQSDSINPQSKVKESKVKESKVNSGHKQIDHRNPDLQSIMDYAFEKGFSLQGNQKQNRLSAYNLLRKKDPEGNALGVDRAKQLIDIAVACRGERFAPVVNDFVSLYKKWQDLLAFVEKKQTKGRIG